MLSPLASRQSWQVGWVSTTTPAAWPSGLLWEKGGKCWMELNVIHRESPVAGWGFPGAGLLVRWCWCYAIIIALCFSLWGWIGNSLPTLLVHRGRTQLHHHHHDYIQYNQHFLYVVKMELYRENCIIISKLKSQIFPHTYKLENYSGNTNLHVHLGHQLDGKGRACPLIDFKAQPRHSLEMGLGQ